MLGVLTINLYLLSKPVTPDCKFGAKIVQIFEITYHKTILNTLIL